MGQTNKTRKLTFLAMMIALDVVLSPVFRVEGMAPMSSVMNVIAAATMGPVYTMIMAFVTAIIRITIMGIPPLALTGAFFGAALAGLFFKWANQRILFAAFGEILGTGLIGSLLSYPVMMIFTGTSNGLYWFVYTPRFFGAAIMGSIVAALIWTKLKDLALYKAMKDMFWLVPQNKKY